MPRVGAPRTRRILMQNHVFTTGWPQQGPLFFMRFSGVQRRKPPCAAMSRPALIDAVTRIARPIVQSVGLEVWGVEVLQSGRPVLRLFVDSPAGATRATPEGIGDGTGADIERCAEISRQLGLALDVEDIFASAYVLEVSSPGLSRVFFAPEQLAPYVGDTVEMHLFAAVDTPDMPEAFAQRRKFRGLLRGVAGTGPQAVVSLLVDMGAGVEALPFSAPWEAIRKVQRVHVFPVKEKPGKKPASEGGRGGKPGKKRADNALE